MFTFQLTVLLLVISLTGVNGQRGIEFPNNAVAVVDDDAKLTCRYHSKSCLEIRWRKLSVDRGQKNLTNISDGNRVYDSRKYRLDNSTVCELVIPKAQLTDAGTFVCTIAGSRHGFADLIVLKEQQSCNTNCEKDSTAEGDMLEFTCKLSGRGGGNPVMAWFNNQTRLEIQNVPYQKPTGDSLSRDFSMKAFAPTVPDLVCLTRFYFSQEAGRAANVPEVQCETESCDILYKVRNVVTSPSWYASPGEEITCKADGNPKPKFKWEWNKNEGDAEWVDVPYEEDKTGKTDETDKTDKTDKSDEKIEAFLSDGTSYQLRCVANNSVKEMEYSAYSPAITVSKHGALIRTAIIVSVVVGVVILLIIAGAVYKFCLEEQSS